MLDAESQRLAAQLDASELSIEEMQARSATEHAAFADELPALRCAFRKRCRDGHSNAIRFACSLNVLEAEMPGQQPQSARAALVWPSPAF